MLDTEFAHVCMPRGFDSGGMGHLESRPGFGKKADGKVDAFLLRSIEPIPPHPEFIRVLDFPCHL